MSFRNTSVFVFQCIWRIWSVFHVFQCISRIWYVCDTYFSGPDTPYKIRTQIRSKYIRISYLQAMLRNTRKYVVSYARMLFSRSLTKIYIKYVSNTCVFYDIAVPLKNTKKYARIRRYLWLVFVSVTNTFKYVQIRLNTLVFVTLAMLSQLRTSLLRPSPTRTTSLLRPNPTLTTSLLRPNSTLTLVCAIMWN